MENNSIIVCGLFEQELVEKGLMKPGRCRDCFYYDGYEQTDFKGNVVPVILCQKHKKRLQKEETDCKDWRIDTR